MQKENVIRTVFVSHLAGSALKKHITGQGHRLVILPSTAATYDAVASHADLYLCSVSGKTVVAKEQWTTIHGQIATLKDQVRRHQSSRTHQGSLLNYDPLPDFITAENAIGYSYPANIGLNGVQLGTHFVHNLRHTDPALLYLIDKTGLSKIHVKQGYSKCNMVVVTENSVITSDEGIAAALKPYGIHVLQIRPGFVELTGFPYGFLGGASGRLNDEILFNGDLAGHPDFAKICVFIESCGLRPRWFSGYPLEDIGSVIVV